MATPVLTWELIDGSRMRVEPREGGWWAERVGGDGKRVYAGSRLSTNDLVRTLPAGAHADAVAFVREIASDPADPPAALMDVMRAWATEDLDGFTSAVEALRLRAAYAKLAAELADRLHVFELRQAEREELELAALEGARGEACT